MRHQCLSQFTVTFLLAILAIFQVTSSYPIHGQTLPHDSDALIIRTLTSPDDPSLTSTSSSEVDLSTDVALHGQHNSFPRNEDADSVPFINRDGNYKFDLAAFARKFTYGPEHEVHPVKGIPTWLNFKIPAFPQPKSSPENLQHNARVPEGRTLITDRLKRDQDSLRKWASNSEEWMWEPYILRFQKGILNGLKDLTDFDLKHADHSALNDYLPEIMKRLWVAYGMSRNPLSWGKYREELEKEIKLALHYFDQKVRE